LSRSIRAELKGLSAQLAKVVGGYLYAAGELIDDDPREALKYALAARRHGSRLPVVREAVAEVAYAAEDFPTALNEYRTLYRMSGNPDYLPVIADCERAVGKPAEALKTLEKAHELKLSPQQQVEAQLVTAGAREDLGQLGEAQRVLKSAIAAGIGGRSGQARLRYAYADLLNQKGDEDGARASFEQVVQLDADGDLDAQERLDSLAGLEIQIDDDFFEDETPQEADAADD
jgi:tetratricopeptide (TPR) repeat protein